MSKSLLKEVAKQIKVTDYLDYRQWLALIYHQAKSRQAHYSYAKLSQDFGLGSSNGHSIIHGKRPLSIKGAQKIALALDLKANQRRYLLALVEYCQSPPGVERDQAFETLQELKLRELSQDTESLVFFQHWYHAAILELLRNEDAQEDSEWICQNLGPKISRKEVQESLNLQKKLGYIKFDEKRGRLYPTDAIVTSGNEVRHLAIVSFHRQMLDLAKVAIDDIDANQREISALTLAIPKSMRQEFKEEIIRLRKQLLNKAASAENTDEVIQLNFQMFPLRRTV